MYKYGPVKRDNIEVWDYSLIYADKSIPIGYCNLKVASKIMTAGRLASYHSSGHSTSKEACECYKKYLLENHVEIIEDGPRAVCHICDKRGVDTIIVIAKQPAFTVCKEHDIWSFLKENFKVEDAVWTSEILGPL